MRRAGRVLPLSFGGKLRLLDRETSPLGLALTGSYSSLEDQKLGMVGAVAGIGSARKSLNLAVNYTDDDEDLKGFISFGVRWFSRNHSSSLSAFRPLVEDSDSFIALPMVM